MEYIACLLGRKEESPGEDLGQRQQVKLKRGDDSEGPAAAAQCPEQVGLVVGVDADLLAVGRDKLDRGYPVTGKAVLASVEAQAPTERVPGDADVGR